jgi:predicted nucleic acid-binding protein
VLVRAWIDDRISIAVSPALLSELERALARPRFAARLDARTVPELVERVRRHTRG